MKNADQARELERADRLQLSKEEIDAEIDKLEEQLQEEPGNL